MDIQVFNTLTRKKEAFSPIVPGHVSMYSCGPTVYDAPHIGNYRTMITNDLVRRVFEYNGYEVNHVMNSTDVDDKTLRRSREEGVTLRELTQKYEKLFLEDLSALGVKIPTHFIRATEHIPDMIDLVQELIDKGIAYKAADGVYFSISNIKNYGALAQIELSDDAKERIANDEYDKDDPRDFALWKFHVPEDGDTAWDAPFGRGRPGWHIECSAMAMKLLGPTLDIHTAGQDLIFPHNTNEIAQSESATGKPFVNYWVHSEFMTMNDQKMAKSKGNTIKIQDLLENSVSPLAYRYWLLTAHYRSPINFTYEAAEAAQKALIRLIATVGEYPENGRVDETYKDRLQEAVNDDFNTPQAVALAWELIKDKTVSDADKRATLLDFDQIFGLRLANAPKPVDGPIPAEIEALAEAREEARKAKEWEKADALRAEIEARGFDILDTPDGFKIIEK